MIQVLVIDDDFRVAEVHATFVGQLSGFQVAATVHSVASARAFLTRNHVDLVLLDHYLPDGSGIELLSELDCDAIMLTAAADASSIRSAFAAGALNYLIKPFTAEQLQERLAAYARYHTQLPMNAHAVSQERVDNAMRVLHDGNRPSSPKGRSPATSRLVAEALADAAEPLSAAAIAADLGIGRATAQRYLAALADEGKAHMSLRYGATGRPEHQYHWIGD